MTSRIFIPALAAALLVPLATAARADGAPMFSGYVDLGAGPGWGQWSGNYFDSYNWRETTFHGAAKAAIAWTPSFVTQFDAWAVNLNGSDDDSGDYNNTQMGAAAHLGWMPGANTLIGLMGSVGQDGDASSPETAFGLEAAHWNGNFRLYGQLGRVVGGGDAEGYSANYIEGVLTYYHTPNMALTGILGYDREQSTTEDYVSDEFDWGARFEFKKDTLPFSLYVSYQGFRLTGSYPGDYTYQAVGHRVIGGIRIPFGGKAWTIQDLDRQAGLSDLNPVYGDIPH